MQTKLVLKQPAPLKLRFQPGATGPSGPSGPSGPANTLTIGDVDTLETGQPATATITGDAPAQQINLGLPKGDKGDKGDPGDALPPDEQYRGEWSPVASYQPNNKVSESGLIYMALIDSLNKQPSLNATYWLPIGVAFDGGALTNKLTVAPSTISEAGLNIPAGVSPTTPLVGDVIFDGLSTRIHTVLGYEVSVAYVNSPQTWYSEQAFAPSGAFGYSIVIPLQDANPSGGSLKIGGIRHDPNGLYVRRTVSGSDIDDKFRTADPASLPTGSLIKTASAANTAWIGVPDTSQIPLDDTMPLVSEGAEILSLSITPGLASSTISGSVTVPIFTQASGANEAIVAVFRGAICVGASAVSLTDNEVMVASLQFSDAPSSTAAQTYTVRIGPTSAAYIFINGDNTSHLLGGASAATIRIDEVRG